MSIQEGVEILEGLKESGAELSYHSLELLTVDDISERESFVRQLKSVPLSRNVSNLSSYDRVFVFRIISISIFEFYFFPCIYV